MHAYNFEAPFQRALFVTDRFVEDGVGGEGMGREC